MLFTVFKYLFSFQRPDVEDDKVISVEEAQLHSLADYDICLDVQNEEPFEGSSLKGEDMSFISVCNCVCTYFNFFHR